MCCSSARRACSDFTRASFVARSSRWYSSFAEVPIFFRSSVTASENFPVAASYSVASRFFSSQLIGPVSHEGVPQSRALHCRVVPWATYELDPFPPWLPAGSRSLSRFSLSYGRALFFCRSFSWALLRASSCARQLRVFCFHGSSRTSRAPPIKQTLALGAEASRSWVPQENGAKKEI